MSTKIKFPKGYKPNEREACTRFRDEICSKDKDVDPSGEQDWFSLSLGFLIACGIKPDRAHTLSIWLRYDMGYFQSTQARSN